MVSAALPPDFLISKILAILFAVRPSPEALGLSQTCQGALFRAQSRCKYALYNYLKLCYEVSEDHSSSHVAICVNLIMGLQWLGSPSLLETINSVNAKRACIHCCHLLMNKT